MKQRFAASLADRLYVSVIHNPDIADLVRRNSTHPRVRLEHIGWQVFFTLRIGDSFVNVDLI